MSVKDEGRRLPDNSGMRKWLADRLDALRVRGKTKSGLARELGVQPARVTEMIAGDRTIKSAEIAPMARYLEMPEAEVLRLAAGDDQMREPAEAPLSVVPVIGHVQAGQFRHAMEWDHDDRYDAQVSPDPVHRTRFGLEVRGTSMNRVFPEGTVVVCVPVMEYAHAIGDGNYVVVHRRNEIGDVEATVKQLQIDENGRAWLWPRSDDPEHQAPMLLPRSNDGHHAGIDECYIVAVVTRADTNMVPRAVNRRLLHG
jgi:repressor LexA